MFLSSKKKLGYCKDMLKSEVITLAFHTDVLREEPVTTQQLVDACQGHEGVVVHGADANGALLVQAPADITHEVKQAIEQAGLGLACSRFVHQEAGVYAQQQNT